MSKATYVEAPCKSFLNRVSGMPFGWSANPYRGCVHDCQYCYARSTHEFLNLTIGDFAKVIQVKVNAPEVLQAELRRPSWRHEQVAVGTATDPYQPIEGSYRLTRRCLEVFAGERTPVSIVTKGTLIKRDMDVLKALTAEAGATVCISIPTVDPEVWRRMEPGTPPPAKRLRVMEELVNAGIHAGVLIAPIVPVLSTKNGALDDVVRAAAEHGARFVGGNVLNLRPGVRGHFFDFLRRSYPGLLPAYQRLYPGSYASDGYRKRVNEVLAGLKERFGIADRPEPKAITPVTAARPVQLSLWNEQPLRHAG